MNTHTSQSTTLNTEWAHSSVLGSAASFLLLALLSLLLNLLP